jgi:hypothetical protein
MVRQLGPKGRSDLRTTLPDPNHARGVARQLDSDFDLFPDEMQIGFFFLFRTLRARPATEVGLPLSDSRHEDFTGLFLRGHSPYGRLFWHWRPLNFVRSRRLERVEQFMASFLLRVIRVLNLWPAADSGACSGLAFRRYAFKIPAHDFLCTNPRLDL